ncbi:hypothetical protein KL86DES1_10726 [uncultured Desulfovibrio sp.]|uniref:Uncharacterized protein n=1 Tax=uncultured Desulfovibrio sp. TaxID=167968 RepID=A0A212L079_9BACT|nr:hypothetical protein KL86DES1_10726 [uncultured Desulfovibrio sp.]VZH32599.1 conserved protein of unknown function [Desulfovibrio sp. 86]
MALIIMVSTTLPYIWRGFSASKDAPVMNTLLMEESVWMDSEQCCAGRTRDKKSVTVHHP